MGKPRKEYPSANQQQEGYRWLVPLLSHVGLGAQVALDFSAIFHSGTSLTIFGILTQMRPLLDGSPEEGFSIINFHRLLICVTILQTMQTNTEDLHSENGHCKGIIP